jgi:hypothetical protein
MVSSDVLACETKELVIVGTFQLMAAWTIDRAHISSSLLAHRTE